MSAENQDINIQRLDAFFHQYNERLIRCMRRYRQNHNGEPSKMEKHLQKFADSELDLYFESLLPLEAMNIIYLQSVAQKGRH